MLWSAKKIAIIEIDGTIGSKVKAETTLPLLARAEKDSKFKALLLIINSPGGSAAAAEEIFMAANRVAAKKPVVVYVRGTCASGGLYISLSAHKIVALSNAAIGSIGVMFTKLVASDLMSKVGLSMAVVKSAAHKDMFAPWRAPTAEETAKLQTIVDDTFERFINVVAEKRKLDKSLVRSIATGEMFGARKAKELGLIDDIGDMETALDTAAKLAGIKRRVQYLRPKRSWRPIARIGFGANLGEEIAEAVYAKMETEAAGKLWM